MPMTRAQRHALIEQYADGPRRLRAALATVPAAAMQWRPKPGEWSAHEVIVHCADSETQSSSRIRILMCDKNPVIQGYYQAQWARDLDYHAHLIDVALATLHAVRAHTTVLIRRLPDGSCTRQGRHTACGRNTAQDRLTLAA